MHYNKLLERHGGMETVNVCLKFHCKSIDKEVKRDEQVSFPNIRFPNMSYISFIIKRPLRDACLCMGELQAPPAPAAPPAPHFVFLITL